MYITCTMYIVKHIRRESSMSILGQTQLHEISTTGFSDWNTKRFFNRPSIYWPWCLKTKLPPCQKGIHNQTFEYKDIEKTL